MLFNIPSIFFTLAFFGAAFANPVDVESRAVGNAVALGDATFTPATSITDIPSTKLKGVVPEGATTFTPNSGFHALGAQAGVDAYVWCEQDNCNGTCYYLALSSINRNTCYTTGAYTSFYINRTSNTGLGYGIFAALTNCNGGVLVPTVNTCYHVTVNGSVRNNNRSFYRN